MEKIAAGCAFLPLTLRVAAERALAWPHQGLASLASQLATSQGRLDALATDDDPGASVHAVLSWSYEQL